jgi:hypothetical protein
MFVEAVSFISIHQICIPSTSDSQLKNSFPLNLCFPSLESRKFSILTLLNHGRAYAMKKAIISCPQPVSQFQVHTKPLESSFRTIEFSG